MMTFPGLIITATTLRRAWREFRAVRRSKINGATRMITCQWLRREVIRMIMHGLIAASMLLFLPRIEGLMDSPAWPMIVARNMLLATVSLLIGLQGALDLRGKHNLLLYIEHRADPTDQR